MEANKAIDEIMEYFKAISKIPRCSGNEKAVSDYLLNFAKSHGLEAVQDDNLNIIIKKPASIGYQNFKTVMLQGHMDMVCVKTEESRHDFQKDPLQLQEKDGFLSAKGTSLGADNGIALAYIMAIIASKNLKHPPLECLITTSEETGMDGVIGLDAGELKSEILINLDSEEEGIFLASSAGGVNNQVDIKIIREEFSEKALCYEICIKGLKGGHSGSEIDKGRGNAIKLMGRLLSELGINKFRVSDIEGGSKRNAIADRCCVEIVFCPDHMEEIEETVKRVEKTLKNELKSADPGLKIEMTERARSKTSMDKRSTEKLVSFLRLMPNGVQTMSMEVDDLVESSINIGLINVEENRLIITSSVRSSLGSLKDEINGRVESICKLLGAEMKLEADYPGWEFARESYIRDVMKESYLSLFGKEAQVKAIHAGLECGFLKEKMPCLDTISIGPDMFDVHSPRERIDISSTQRTWHFLIKTLENIKE